MDLSADLGMDSLDQADILSFLAEQYDVKGIQPGEVTSVGKTLQLAAGLIKPTKLQQDEVDHNMKVWNKKVSHKEISFPDGETLPEVFLRNCDRWPSKAACADVRTGVLTYRQLKMKVLILAEYIKTLPGENIGILLPSSVTANVCVLATQLAGKTPVMINWTVGPRHLDTVIEVSRIEKVLTSWAFLERVENVDFGPIDDMLVMLEELRNVLAIGDKIKGFSRSYKSADKLLRIFQGSKLTRESRAVILFTSGTEGMPKGVPLSHRNLISNMKAVIKTIKIYTDDVVYGFLPPFHSFGFTITGLLPLLGGMKVVYYPDPTDSAYLAKGIKEWGVSIIASAPTFIRGILSAADKDGLDSLRLVVSGAEKAPIGLTRWIKKETKATYAEGYGITECSPTVSVRIDGCADDGVGKPIADVELSIVHPEKHTVLPQGKRGLILVHGPNVFSGYP